MKILMQISTHLPAIVINIPIIISIIAATRYVIGLKTWRNYPTVALTLAYYFFYQYNNSMIIATIAWFVFYATIVGVATYTRYAIRTMKMNFYARLSFIYLAGTIIALILFLVLENTNAKQFILSSESIIGIFLILTTLDETATLLFKKGSQEYIRRMFATTILALLSGMLLVWPWWNLFIEANPLILAVVLIIDLLTASWSALRLTEFLRFAPIIKQQK